MKRLVFHGMAKLWTPGAPWLRFVPDLTELQLGRISETNLFEKDSAGTRYG